MTGSLICAAVVALLVLSRFHEAGQAWAEGRSGVASFSLVLRCQPHRRRPVEGVEGGDGMSTDPALCAPPEPFAKPADRYDPSEGPESDVCWLHEATPTFGDLSPRLRRPCRRPSRR